MTAKISEETKLDWLRLIRSEHVGPRTFRALLDHCGGARAAVAALPELARRGGASGTARICSRQEAERELAAMKRLGIGLLAMGEPEYPYRLAMIDDAPPLLAVRGHLATLASPMVAIVGARNASAAGVRLAERFARELGEAGFAIVSGLARGIDAGAHRGSLASGTVAVLAGGHDHIYPPEHKDLAETILAQGPRFRNATRLAAAGGRLSPPQSSDLGIGGGRPGRGSGEAVRLADHSPACARTRP